MPPGEYFRTMTRADDGLPVVGRSARSLGVRVPEDIQPDAAGRVVPGQGGMSVAPGSFWNLPNHRRPRGLGRGSTGPCGFRKFCRVNSGNSGRLRGYLWGRVFVQLKVLGAHRWAIEL